MKKPIMYIKTIIQRLINSLRKTIISKFITAFDRNYFYKYRSSHWRCSVKKCVLRNFTKFTGKHLRQILCFNKVVGLYHIETSPLICCTS